MPHCSKLIVVPCVQNFTVNECGAVHITMGDGGNIEGLCKLLVPSLTPSKFITCMCHWIVCFMSPDI